MAEPATPLKRTYFVCAYAVSWAMFGAVGLALNAVCALLLLLPRRPERAAQVRRAIRLLFAGWIKWLHATRLIPVVWHGLDRRDLPRRAVYVANHPSLLDATFLLAVLPDALCIFKPKLRGNPCLAPAAIMAGYASGDGGVDMIRELAPQVADGNPVLIFPEGTRTDPDKTLNPLKSGFAFIAQRANAPIQILAIRAPRDLCPRGASWWHPPRFPSQIDIFVGGLVLPDPARTVEEVVAEVQARLLGQLEGLA
jgi:1-acyl-sn-glycerol-3-phosphate acyltransferase